MEITQADRMEMLEDIKKDLGFVERDDDEFTAKEIAKSFEILPQAVVQYFETNDVKYERRKAIVDGRKLFVYKFIKE